MVCWGVGWGQFGRIDPQHIARDVVLSKGLVPCDWAARSLPHMLDVSV